MPHIIYAWEAGASLGHVSVFLPVAKRLRARGHELTFVIPFGYGTRKGFGPKTILEANGFRCLEAPGASSFTERKKTNCHADIVRNIPAFSNTAALSYVLKSWCTLYDDERPDLVVGDFSLCALLAAKTAGIPTVSLDLGYYYPDPELPLPVFGVPDAPEAWAIDPVKAQNDSEQGVLATINAVLAAEGAELLESFSDIYDADHHLLLNYPELCAFPRKNGDGCLGAVDSENGGPAPVWPTPDAPGGRIFAYLHGNSDNMQAVVEALSQETSRSILLYFPACPEKLIEHYTSSHLTIVTAPLDMTEVLATANLTICNGGVGLVTRSLLAGVPMILLPLHLEQSLNADRVVNLGAGRKLAKVTDAAEVRDCIEQVLSNSMMRAQARAFKYRHRPAEPEHVADVVERVLTSPAASTLVRRGAKARNKTAKVRDYDVVFLSYDEPNADENWAHLQAIVPNAKRVHGVKGFDAAHKAAAASADTHRFVLVDADNQISPEFFDLELEVPPQLEHAVWQWCSVNHVNGLAYPFGGIKIWTQDVIAEMKTHEACSDASSPLATDFWAQPAYQVFSPSFSTNFTNGSPYQAFRAGFRETHKLTRWYGRVKTPADFEALAKEPQARRVSIWMSVGADVEHGYWSLLGARMGFLKCFDEAFSEGNINEYDWFAEMWDEVFTRICRAEGEYEADGKSARPLGGETLVKTVLELGAEIRAMIKRPPVLDMSPEQSRNFRAALIDAMPKSRPAFTYFMPNSDFQ